MRDKPTIVRVTTDWLLQHDSQRYGYRTGIPINTYRVELDKKMRMYLSEPRTMKEIREHFDRPFDTIKYALGRIGARCIRPKARNKSSLWSLEQ